MGRDLVAGRWFATQLPSAIKIGENGLSHYKMEKKCRYDEKGDNCSVAGCKNNRYKLRKWKLEECSLHIGLQHRDCPCLLPYTLHAFPREVVMKRKWEVAISKKDFIANPKYSKVCSIHFVDGRPTTLNPFPELKLGYPEKRLQCVVNNPVKRVYTSSTLVEEQLAMHPATATSEPANKEVSTAIYTPSTFVQEQPKRHSTISEPASKEVSTAIYTPSTFVQEEPKRHSATSEPASKEVSTAIYTPLTFVQEQPKRHSPTPEPARKEVLSAQYTPSTFVKEAPKGYSATSEPDSKVVPTMRRKRRGRKIGRIYKHSKKKKN